MDFDAQFKELDPDVLKAFKAAQAGVHAATAALLLTDHQAPMQYVHAGMKIPDYDFAADRKEISDLFDPLIKQAEEMGQQAETRLAEIKNEMKALDEERVRV